MREPVHEAPVDRETASPHAGSDPGGLSPPDRGPERRCILTGRRGRAETLIRLAEGPDGAVWPDLGARLGGRGAWVVADGTLLTEAVARGTLARALARAWRRPPPRVPADLPARIGEGLERRLLDRLGLERRAGRLLFGSEKIVAEARAGRLRLLLHAADAAADGVARLDQALRAGGGPESRAVRLPLGRERLSRALGRDNMVHVGITDGRTAVRVMADLARLLAFMHFPAWQVTAKPVGAGRGDERVIRLQTAAACAAHENEGSE